MATHKSTRKTAKSKGELSTRTRKRLPRQTFAFPKERKEPLTDKEHVKNALARFDQVKGVSDSERKTAFQRIKRAAKKEHLDVNETNYRQLGKRPHTRNAAHKKKS